MPQQQQTAADSTYPGNQIEIFLLRDAENKPHITIEFDLISKKIKQIQGSSAVPVKENYLGLLNEFIRKHDIKISKNKKKELRANGLVYLDGVLFNINSLPDNTVVSILDLAHTKTLKRLPNNLTATDSLILVNSSLTELPKGLTAKNLNLAGSRIRQLPPDLQVTGTLNISSTDITELPCGLFLDSLIAFNSKLTELPQDIKISRNLDLQHSKIKRLPDGLELTGDLILSSCDNICMLPENIVVGGSLMINNTDIKELPATVRAGQIVTDNKNLISQNKQLNIKYL